MRCQNLNTSSKGHSMPTEMNRDRTFGKHCNELGTYRDPSNNIIVVSFEIASLSPILGEWTVAGERAGQ